MGRGEEIVKRWRALGELLITKYNDGYVKDEKDEPQEKGYSEDWLRGVTTNRPGQFTLPVWGDAEKQKGLLD